MSITSRYRQQLEQRGICTRDTPYAPSDSTDTCVNLLPDNPEHWCKGCELRAGLETLRSRPADNEQAARSVFERVNPVISQNQ